jgi:hypothetical protein
MRERWQTRHCFTHWGLLRHRFASGEEATHETAGAEKGVESGGPDAHGGPTEQLSPGH